MKKITGLAIVAAFVLTACKNSQTKEDADNLCSLTEYSEQTEDSIVTPLRLFGIPLQGDSEAEVINKLLGQENEMKLIDNRDNVTIVNFCGIECGLNISFDNISNQVSATSVLLLTSKTNKKTFEQLKKGIEQYYGEPDVEDYEEGGGEIDGRFCGRCNWYRDCDITLRHLHDSEGGFGILFSPRPSLNKL